MTVHELLHAFGNNCAQIFQDLRTGEHCAENDAEYKKIQAIFEKDAERQIRKAIADEG